MKTSKTMKKGASAPFFVAALLCCVQIHAAAQSLSLKEQLEKGNVILSAHRGGMYAEFAENSINTLEYLEAMFAGKPVMAEVDVRKSKDGTLFLLHDETLERTTSGYGKIEDHPDLYLNLLKLKRTDGKATMEKLPTFSELLDFVAKHPTIYLMLDVKIDDWKQVLHMVKSKGLVSRCMVLTFTADNSKKAHDASPEMLVSCLVKDRNDLTQVSKVVPSKVMMAYVNKNTPADVIKELKDKKIFLVTDASEATTNEGKTYPAEFYKGLNVNVLVTDMPKEVNALLK